MALIGFIVMIIGAAGFLLTFTGFASLIPQIDQVSSRVWIAMIVVGALLFFITRRAKD